MKNIIIALLIGLVAGIIDVLPMIIQKLDKYSNLSAFVHWLVLGLIIPFVSWGISPWLQGLIIGELSAIPVIITQIPKDKKAIVPIIVMSAILGALVGFAGNIFIR